MKREQVTAGLAITMSVFFAGVLLAAEDRFTVQAPNGIAFSEFRGYEAWQLIAPSQPDNEGGCGSSPAPGCIKGVVGNPTMIKAYGDGFPANGKSVPDGAVMAKIEWQKKSIKAPPYGVTAPGSLQEVSFMLKDSKRFPGTDGWGYATFNYDQASGEWKAFGGCPAFASKCHSCHTIVKARDFVYTAYPQR